MNTKKTISILIGFLFFIILGPAYAQSGAGIFAVYGDSRTNHDTHRKIVQLIVKARPEAVFHTGDMVERATSKRDWDKFNEITAQMRSQAEFFPAVGTHDNDSAFFSRNFPYLLSKRWYSLDRAGVHFIILDCYSKLEPGSPQYGWLEADLKNAKKKQGFIAVILHDALFSSGHHSPQPVLIRDLVPLLETHGVDIVFSGHDHHYERSYRNNIYYVITGGGGAELRGRKRANPFSQVFKKTNHFCLISVSGTEMMIDVIDTDSRRIDSFKVEGRPR